MYTGKGKRKAPDLSTYKNKTIDDWRKLGKKSLILHCGDLHLEEVTGRLEGIGYKTIFVLSGYSGLSHKEGLCAPD